MQTLSLLFDLDDTLINRKLSVCEYGKELFHQIHVNCSIDSFLDKFILYDKNGYANRLDFANNLIHDFNLNIDADTFALDFPIYAFKKIFLNDGAIEVLKYCKDNRIKTGIITNGSISSQRCKIDNSGIKDFLSTVIISEEVGFKKPNKEIFDIASISLGVKNSDCLYVGDHFENDYMGAINAGMRSIWFSSTANTNSIANLIDLLNFV